MDRNTIQKILIDFYFSLSFIGLKTFNIAGFNDNHQRQK
jgi:hypothetical protein